MKGMTWRQMENKKISDSVTKKAPLVIQIIKLQIVLLFYSFFGIASKLAAGEKMFSHRFFLYYGVILMNLALFALVWQQIIKHMSLVTAYCNKVSVIIWGMVFGCLFFHESITVYKLIGIAMVVVGVILVVREDGTNG